MAPAIVAAQPTSIDPPPTPAGAVEQYLADRGMTATLAAYLMSQLRAAEGAERARLARRLSRLQIQLFEQARTPEEQARWEVASRNLLAQVPEAETAELRLGLSKVRYRRAEEAAERAVLRLTSPEETQRTISDLRQLASTFGEVAARATRMADQIDRRLESAREEDQRLLRTALDDARQVQAEGSYFAGWSGLYAALLARDRAAAETALIQLGVVLDALPGRAATLDRVQPNSLRWDHVARAALATAVGEALRGRDDTALRWLEFVESSADTPDELRAQVWSRRVIVLSLARRWADLDFQVNRRLSPGGSRRPSPLTPAEARLLAISTLEALSDPSTTPQVRPLVQSLADTAIGQLIAAQELASVFDLVKKFGIANLPGDGFVAGYARGLQLYERAREQHAATGASEEPTTRADLAQLYRDAAQALANAAGASDSARFPAERAGAVLTSGLALFFANDPTAAADRLEAALGAGLPPKRAEDAHWMAIVALETLERRGDLTQRQRLTRLVATFLAEHPRSERAVTLLLSPIGGRVIEPEKVLDTLLSVDPATPLGERARRHAANLLYTAFTRAGPAQRDFAASRFLSVADEALRIERRLAAQADASGAPLAIEAVLLRLRQILDAALGSTSPDLTRAAESIDAIPALAASAGIDLAPLEPELALRRLQMALVRGRTEEIARSSQRVQELGGLFAQRADRLMYNRAIGSMSTGAPDERVLRDVAHFGQRIINAAGPAPLDDPRMLGVMASVADAAARLFELTGDTAMRDRAITIDRQLTSMPSPPLVSLRRLARLHESAGDPAAALDAWRALLARLDPQAPAWLEARFQSLRLLAPIDPAAAREALAQLKVLMPDMGGPDWAPRFRSLEEGLPPPPASTGGAP